VGAAVGKNLKQHSAFLVAERGGRLVKHDEPRATCQRLDNLDDLPVSQFE
jgi:hypothetical protein